MDISGWTISFVGRPAFVTRQAARRLALRSGAKPELGDPSPGGIAVHGLGGTIGRIRRGNLLDLREKLRRQSVRHLSEIGFLRSVGILPAAAASDRLIGAPEFARLSGLDEPMVWMLSVAGAFECEADRYSFRDVRVAREIAVLLGKGYRLAGIAEAAALTRRHQGTRMTVSGAEIGVRLSAVEIDFAGQTTLPFGGSGATLSEIFERAEEAEQARDFAAARRFYGIAVTAKPYDAVARYNLGCVLMSLEELGDAEIHFRVAASLDPAFAEAWFNAAHIRGLKGDLVGERRFLEQALEADPDYVDALACLARGFIRSNQIDEACVLLERIARLGIPATHEDFVRKATLFCRLAKKQPQSRDIHLG